MTKKKIIIICIACVIVTIFAALLYSSVIINRDIIGIWSGEWTFEGKHIVKAIKFMPDGTYKDVTLVDGNLSETQEGTYKISFFKVICKLPTAGEFRYQYSWKKLTGKKMDGVYYLYKDYLLS